MGLKLWLGIAALLLITAQDPRILAACIGALPGLPMVGVGVPPTAK